MPKNQSESRIQSNFITWLWNTYPRTRGLAYHIPNGGLRTQREAMTLKAMGVLPGIPDVHIVIAARGHNSLYIEFKEPNARINTEHHKKQLAVHEVLRSAGHAVYVCTSAEDAQCIVLEYLENTYWIAS
jgi:hypothetical protein